MNMESDKRFSDYFAIVRRRYVTILLTFLAILVPGVFFTYSLPPVYKSTASFLVEQQTISQDFVQTTVTGYTDEKIQEVRQRVMSNSNLAKLIEKYDLFPEKTDSLAEAIELFEERTTFEPEVAEVVNERTGRTMLATITFDVSFEYSDPVIVQKVAADLAQSYLRENELNRMSQVEETVEFLEADIERLKDDVDAAANALADFRREHAGSLPDQANVNLRTIDRLENQLLRLEEDARNARDRKLRLEAELINAQQTASTVDDSGNPIAGTAQRLSELQRERLRLLSLYSPQHPDVIKINKEIEALSGNLPSSAYLADIQAQLDVARSELAIARQRYSDSHPDVVQKQQAVAALEERLDSAMAANRPYQPTFESPEIRVIRDQIAAVDSDLRSFARQESELRARIRDLETRLGRVPELDRQFAVLTRESEQAVARYNEALDKLDEAKMAERLEQGGGGERFTLIGSPRIPANPYKPNRTALVMLFLVLSLGAGLILATIKDSLDRTIKSPADVFVLAEAPVLAVVPYIETPEETRQRIGKNVGLATLVVISFITIGYVMFTAG